MTKFCLFAIVNKQNLMYFTTIRMKITLFWECVLRLLNATVGHQASMASSQTTIFGSGKFLQGFYGGGDQQQRISG